jgi:hypothetical protein
MESVKCEGVSLGKMVLGRRELRSELSFLALCACLTAPWGVVCPFHSANNNGSGIACVFVLPGIQRPYELEKCTEPWTRETQFPYCTSPLLYEVFRVTCVRKHYVQPPVWTNGISLNVGCLQCILSSFYWHFMAKTDTCSVFLYLDWEFRIWNGCCGLSKFHLKLAHV